MNINKVALGGRLTADPEGMHTSKGVLILRFSLAINHKYKSGDEWLERTSFIDCKLFGPKAEAFAKYHQKGDEAIVFGRVHQDRWDDKVTGQARSRVLVECDEWEFAGSRQRPANQEIQVRDVPAGSSVTPQDWDDLDNTPF